VATAAVEYPARLEISTRRISSQPRPGITEVPWWPATRTLCRTSGTSPLVFEFCRLYFLFWCMSRTVFHHVPQRWQQFLKSGVASLTVDVLHRVWQELEWWLDL
jgi:hypothetical protein